VLLSRPRNGANRLAYTVKKFNNGFYVFVDFCANPGVTTELERNLNLDDRIIKYQTVKIAEKADPQELLEKEKENQKASAPVAPEEVQQEPAAAPVEEIGVKETEESEVENG